MNEELKKEEIRRIFWPHPFPSLGPPKQVTITGGINRDKVFAVTYHVLETALLALIESHDTAIRIDELERLDAQFPDFRETGQTTYTIEDIEKFSKYFIYRLAYLRGKGEAE